MLQKVGEAEHALHVDDHGVDCEGASTSRCMGAGQKLRIHMYTKLAHDVSGPASTELGHGLQELVLSETQGKRNDSTSGEQVPNGGCCGSPHSSML